MMTATPASPADLARTALRRIAELKLPPTPELCTQHYYAAAGAPQPSPKLPETDTPAARVDEQLVGRVEGILAKASNVTESLAESVSAGSDEVAASLESLVADPAMSSATRTLAGVLLKLRLVRHGTAATDVPSGWLREETQTFLCPRRGSRRSAASRGRR